MRRIMLVLAIAGCGGEDDDCPAPAICVDAYTHMCECCVPYPTGPDKWGCVAATLLEGRGQPTCEFIAEQRCEDIDCEAAQRGIGACD